ncbi:VENN motif pre-toxin domain-containing protein [Mannheimia haemolytica]|uniref:VENN motif pre-toxin domain-containing protein n=1 Tax=Mannheimia haemolytica TaxID=75985 RepID=UPI003AFAC2FE
MAGAISPYINTEIKKATEGNEAANLIAHAIWGAVEAYTQGDKAGTGAVAAVTGEVGANIIAKNLFGKEPENLTEAEKRTVSELSQVAAGLTGGLSASGGNSLSTAQAVKTGQGIGKNAVENNTFGDDVHPSEDRRQTIETMAKAMFEGDEEKAEKYYELHKKDIHKLQLQEYLTLILAKGLPQITTGSIGIAAAFGGGSELLGQLSENNGDFSKIDKGKIAIQTGVGVVTKNMGVVSTASVNSGVEFLSVIKDGSTNEEATKKAGISWLTTFGGGLIGKSVEIPLDKKLNPNWKNYVEKTGHLPYGMSEPFKPSYIPSVTGNALDNSSSKMLEGYLLPAEGNKNEKE